MCVCVCLCVSLALCCCSKCVCVLAAILFAFQFQMLRLCPCIRHLPLYFWRYDFSENVRVEMSDECFTKHHLATWMWVSVTDTVRHRFDEISIKLPEMLKHLMFCSAAKTQDKMINTNTDTTSRFYTTTTGLWGYLQAWCFVFLLWHSDRGLIDVICPCKAKSCYINCKCYYSSAPGVAVITSHRRLQRQRHLSEIDWVGVPFKVDIDKLSFDHSKYSKYKMICRAVRNSTRILGLKIIITLKMLSLSLLFNGFETW